MVVLIDQGIMQWPEWQSDYPIMLATDILVIISGSLLWRMELANRAESLKMIWQKARLREESLNRAEVRWNHSQPQQATPRRRLLSTRHCFKPASHHQCLNRV